MALCFFQLKKVNKIQKYIALPASLPSGLNKLLPFCYVIQYTKYRYAHLAYLALYVFSILHILNKKKLIDVVQFCSKFVSWYQGHCHGFYTGVLWGWGLEEPMRPSTVWGHPCVLLLVTIVLFHIDLHTKANLHTKFRCMFVQIIHLLNSTY